MDTAEETKRQRKKEWQRAYYLRNKERLSVQKKQWAGKNRAKKKEDDKRWRQANKERVAKKVKEYQQSHKSQVNATNRRWQKRNWEKHIEYQLQYNHAKRARMEIATVNMKAIRGFVRAVKAKAFCTCYYCGSKVSSKKIHFDHIIPIAKGGQHSVENLCVSCPPCNMAKHDKPIEAWVRIGQQVFAL